MSLDMNAALKITAGVSGQSQIDSMRGSLARVKDQATDLNKKFLSLKTGLAGLAGALSIGAIAGAVKQYADFADNMGKAAARAGVLTEEFSRLSFAAKLSDVDTQTLSRGLRVLGNDAAAGGDKLRALGIDLTDASGRAKTSDQLFREVADRIAGIEDPARKAAVATQLFGDRIGPQLIPLLNAGSAGLRDMGDEAERFGQVVDDEAAVAAAQFNDNLTRLKSAAQGLQFELGNRLIPTLTRLTNEFLVGMKHADGFLDALRKFGTINPFRSQTENIQAYEQDLIRLQERLERLQEGGGRIRGRSAQIQGVERAIEVARARIAFLREMEELSNPPPRPEQTDPGAFDLAQDDRRERERQQRILAQQRELQRLADARRRMIQGMEDDVFRLTQGEDALTILNAQRLGANAEEIAQIERLIAQRNRIREQQQNMAAEAKEADRQQQESVRRYNELRNAAARYYDQTRTPAERLNNELARQRELLEALGPSYQDTYDRAVRAAQEAYDAIKRQGEETTNDLTRAIEQMGGRFADTFADFVTRGKANFRDLVNSILSDIARLFAKRAMDPLVNAAVGGLTRMFGFANGGIMSGSGPMPLRAYSRGGIANSPQLALFGEGSMPEAYVPLPDGRSIPVSFKGGGAGGGDVFNITVPVTVDGAQSQAMDTQGASALGKAIASAVRAELINQRRPGGLLAA